MAELTAVTINVRVLVNDKPNVKLWRVRAVLDFAKLLGVPLKVDIT